MDSNRNVEYLKRYDSSQGMNFKGHHVSWVFFDKKTLKSNKLIIEIH